MSPPYNNAAGMTAVKRLASRAQRQNSIRWFIVVLLFLLIYITALVWVLSNESIAPFGLSEGERAPATVVAAVDFTCMDLAKTQMEQAQTERRAPPVFTLNMAPLSFALRSLDKLFDRLIEAQSLVNETGAGLSTHLASALDLLGLPLLPEEVLSLASPGLERDVQDAMRTALRKTWQSGIVSEEDQSSRFRGIAPEGMIVIKRTEGSWDYPISLDRLLTPEEAVNVAVQETLALSSATNLPIKTLGSLFRAWFVPNLVYDPISTAENRKAARNAVPPSIMTVKAGATLVERGQRLTAQHIVLLTAHEERLRALEAPYERLLRHVGIGGFLLGALMLALVMALLLQPELVQRDSYLVLWLLLTATTLLIAQATSRTAQLADRLPASALIFTAPVAWAPLMAALLLGARASLIIGVWTSCCLAAFFRNDFALLPYGWLVAAVMAHSTVVVRKRSQIYRAGLMAGLIAVFFALTTGTLQQQSVEVVLIRAATGLICGLACGFLASLLVYFFEWAFKTTTDLTLLELSDLSHPLLQRLAIEAAGTYHHSIVTAHLAEAAATQIGANALLARVAAYFHDIGKLTKPDFYIENTSGNTNPHNELAPEMSALLIRSHIQEGVTLARRYKLPICIQDAIRQHHGTSLISFFYKQALQLQNGNAAAIKESSFRYDGPIPQTREMGILMLADGVEAAARSLERPDAERISNMIRDITNAKIKEGQLDDCPLSMAEIRKIREAFAFSLANMLHIRIAYPDHEHQDNQPPTKSENTIASAAKADPVAGAARVEKR